MDNRHTTFGLSRKNPGAWASAFLMLCSAVLRIVLCAFFGDDGLTGVMCSAKTAISGWSYVLLLCLPAAAGLIFAVRVIVCGRDRLYKTSFSVFMAAAFLIIRQIRVYRFSDGQASLFPVILICLLSAAAFFVWELTVNGARIKTKLAAVCVLLALAVLLSIFGAVFSEGGVIGILSGISVILMPASLLIAAASLEKLSSEGFRPRRGDRPDGRLVRTLDPMNGVAIYIMPNRNGAATYFADKVECSRMEEYIHKKREQGLDSFGTMHVIAAAYVRVLAQHPACNRFISGQRIYTRDGDIELAMVVKKDMKADAPETIIKVHFSPSDTAEDVYRKFNEQVMEAKKTPLDSGFDNLAGLINIVPGVVKKFLIWFLKTLDYFGKLPRALMELSPFHGSVFVTALGSLGIPPVFHHLYDFGNIPAFIAFGARHTENELDSEGSPVRRKYIDYTIVTDERICDGFYYASAFKTFRRNLNNPEKLDLPPEKVLSDVF